MHSLAEALATFSWFLGQMTPVFAISLFGLLPAGWAFDRSAIAVRRRLWWLALLPGLWVFVGIWGGLFERELRHGRGYGPAHPAWVSWPLDNGLLVFSLMALVLIVVLRDARPFAVAIAAINLPVMVAMSAFAGMAVSGVRL